MTQYAEQAFDDLQTLEIAGPDVSRQWQTVRDLHRLVELTGNIDGYRPTAEYGVDLRTAYGRRIDAVQQTGVIFETRGSQVCSEAEWRLLENIDCERLADRRLASPLIVMAGQTACGVIKSHGEPTCYGLVDIPDLGLYRGFWHDVRGTEQHTVEFYGNTAFTVSLDSVDRFLPIRASYFCIPVAERRQLDPGDSWPDKNRTVCLTSSAAVRRLVGRALYNAVELSPTA